MSHYIIEISYDKIIINGIDTCLLIENRKQKNIIYRPENKSKGLAYCEIELPGKQYSSSEYDISGWNELVADVIVAMKFFGATIPPDIASGQFTFEISITAPHP